MDNLIGKHDVIENLQSRLSLMTQERDTAIEMWKLAEAVANNVKDEMKSNPASNRIESLKKEMETMQQDYSDAIKLLEFKLKSLEKELKTSREKAKSSEEELMGLQLKLSYIDEEKGELEFTLKKLKSEKEETDKSLKLSQKKLDEAAQVAAQARNKVKDALAMAQDALANEANLLEEKEKLEKRLNEVVEEMESQLEKEIDNVKSGLNGRIEALSNQLQVALAEKNKSGLEYESMKAEYNLKCQEASLKYNSFEQELQELRSRRQSEINQWSEERDILRKQLISLQTELEHALIKLKQNDVSHCPNCTDMKKHLDKYRLLAKEWEEAAYSVTKEFEKYNSEVKKFKSDHKCS
ncbi:tropomyosin isoform X1 [Halyomorpha halys]|uniref:tropomyosin isoform X1 n=2 Tax=Halyomorpha halys TaxID=286706 RepID=UPI0006D4FCAE|nr:probable DNA double-strand break repair Rad50 ATPase isoform X1 [Halyomorpha halys]